MRQPQSPRVSSPRVSSPNVGSPDTEAPNTNSIMDDLFSGLGLRRPAGGSA